MTRAWNFSAGPAAMPEAVLKQAASEMLDWRDNGMGVMEMSHRGKAFMGIYEQAEADLRELLAVPSHFRILFMQGGGLAENAIVPLNLSQGGAMDFVLTGSWSQKSHQDAGKYGCARVAASAQAGGFTTLPDPASWQLGADSRYVHICSNETIHGIEFHELPDLRALGCDAPLVMDFSSHVASRPVNWSRVGLAFGGAQKNLGPAGLTLVIVREDLLGRALPACPSAFDYQLVADNQSMYNTPPTYSIYIAGLVFQWLKSQGGITAMEQRNIAKAQLLYEFIDGSQLYVNTVDTACRSRMNVPFFLRGDDGQPLLDPAHPRNVAFLQATQAAGLLQLKGHASVGGMRASIYNAMPIEGVQALIASMREFERTGT
ncbi:3-phosphoserine/phosphohydroxythreonine transaminase [Limnohabitans sp.]|uniref:3-phosphoserine/phosphohydroxythreonine transaminase n=1 Tax=Limnohabitans sp. TaxID=1907725 RepID=UPI00391B8398